MRDTLVVRESLKEKREEGRVGKACRYRWSRFNQKKTKNKKEDEGVKKAQRVKTIKQEEQVKRRSER